MNTEQIYSLYTQSYTVTTDSRNIHPNCLYFAFKGEKFNGNEYAEQAIKKGALASFVEEEKFANPSINIFYVKNTLETLQKLSQYHRNKLKIPIIGLTGSNGKTTTKELIAAVLQQKFKTLFTKGNFNNHLGVPLTLLSISPEYEIAIIEMGANHLKEIEFLCSLAQPTLGYITNFGKAHLEGFGSVEGVIQGKSELYGFLKSTNGTVIINKKEEKQIEKAEGIISEITFGTPESDYYYELIENQKQTLSVQYNNMQINSNLTGNYNFSNLSVAISLGLHFKISIEEIKKGIENYFPENHRSQIIKKNGKTIVMDAYNANPSSMEVALHNFSTYNGTKTVILGDMFDLGTYTDIEHQKIIQLSEKLNFTQCIFVGKHFTENASNTSLFFEEKRTLVEFIKKTPITSENILIKGSRGVALETLLEEF